MDLCFEVRLENSRTDRAFMLSIAKPEWRKKLEEWERNDWLRFIHGGGFPQIVDDFEGYVRNNRSRSMPRRCRLWFVFDSDRLRPDGPVATEPRRLVRRCDQYGAGAWCLQRRCIESYLPEHVIRAWAEAHAEPNCLTAWRTLTEEQRRFVNLSKGILKDLERLDLEANARAFWLNVSQQTMDQFASGFNKSKLGALYVNHLHHDTHDDWTFERINTQGTEMSEVHMVAAITWSKDFDFAERVDSVRSSLENEGWYDVENKIILQMCKAALDMDVTKAPRREAIKTLSSHPEVIDQVKDGVIDAVSFLRDHCHVYARGLLPYSYQLVLLADAFRRGVKDDDTKSLLVKWFWSTSIAEYFAGMNSARWNRARSHVLAMLDEARKTDALPPDISQTVRPLRRFDMRAARSRAIITHLARPESRNPLYQSSIMGTSMDRNQDAALEKMSKSLTNLARHGANAVPKLFGSQELGRGTVEDGIENRVICDPISWRYTRRQLIFNPESVDSEFREMNSIDDTCVAALKRHDYRGFLNHRRDLLREFEKQIVEAYGLSYDAGDYGDNSD